MKGAEDDVAYVVVVVVVEYCKKVEKSKKFSCQDKAEYSYWMGYDEKLLVYQRYPRMQHFVYQVDEDQVACPLPKPFEVYH
jgi:hypothetical protein